MATSAWLKAVLCGTMAATGGGAAYTAGKREGARVEAQRAKAKPRPRPAARPPARAAATPACPVCTCPPADAGRDAGAPRFLPWTLPPQPVIAAPGGLIAPLAGQIGARLAHSLALASPVPWVGPGGGTGLLPAVPDAPPPPGLAPAPGTPLATIPQPIPAPPGIALMGLGAALLLGAARWRARRGGAGGAGGGAC